MDLQQPQCTIAILLSYSSSSLLRKGSQEPVSFCRSQAAIHHDLPPDKVKREHGTITRIKEAIESHGNPFGVEASFIYNFIMHAYIPDEFVPQMLNMYNAGQTLYKDYVSEWITGDVSLCSRDKRKEYDVHVWQQELNNLGLGQECGSEGNERFVWALNGPCSFEQRH